MTPRPRAWLLLGSLLLAVPATVPAQPPGGSDKGNVVATFRGHTDGLYAVVFGRREV